VRRELELRPWPYIVVGYVLAPFAGLTVIFLSWLARVPWIGWGEEPGMWLVVIAAGEVAGIVIELVLVTPLLIGFNRYRWRWLSGQAGVLFGAAVGIALALLLEPPAVWIDDNGGNRPIAILHYLAVVVLPFGAAWATWALVFRLTAMRVAPPPEAIGAVFE
jgi:hypothetical protein